MSIAKRSVTRPVTVIMIFLGIILLGFISWNKLPQELFPSLTYPQITVVTAYENAAPEEIENLITKIIEEAVGTVNNVKRISSISKEGLSLVMVEFNWGTNMDFAALNVREKIDLVKERIPRESGEPIVMKYNPFDLPIMNLAVTGPMSPLELRELCRRYVKDAIEKVEGVASAIISGGDEREILAEIDQPRLRASQISIVSVVDSLKSANINYPAGTIKESFYEYLIRTMGEYQKVEEIKETPTALDLPEEEAKTVKEKEEKEKQGRRLVYLKDIAQVKDTIKEKTSISRYNNKDSVSLVVRKQSGTNTLNVVKGVKMEIQRLLAEKLPKEINIQVTYDQSQSIHDALNNVRDAALQGAFLAFIVILFMLKDFRSSIVITISIPISILATFCLMFFTNININVMSLGGLALAVGMLVDDAIVVIENIFRHREMKKGLKQACIEGTEEMISPVMGTTLTTVVVFLPFAFVVGVIGQVFKQLSLTITFALLTSIITAICLTPVLISLGRQRELKDKKWPILENQTKGLLSKFGFSKKGDFVNSYRNFIQFMLERKIMVLICIGGLFIVSLIILFTMDRQFLPKVDQRQFIVKVDLAPGTRLEVTDSVVKKIERLLMGIPETKDVTANIGSPEEKASSEEVAIQTMGSHQAQIMIDLKNKSKKLGITRSTDDVINYLKTNLEKQDLEGAQIEYVAQETSFGAALEQGAPIAIEIKGPDLNQLQVISSAMQSQLKKIAGIYGIKSSMPASSPETKLHILKDKASIYGLSVRDIAVSAQVALKGYVATKFKEKEGQEDVDIRVRLRSQDRSDLGNLRRLLIHSPLGMDVSMSDVAYFTNGSGPTEIKRVDQQRSIVLTANIYKRKLSQIILEINKVVDSLTTGVSKDYSIELAGEQQRMKESFKSLAFALTLAFILVYMIMAAEFESLWQPLLIMFTIPISLIGAAFALFLTRTPLSTVAYLGLIMLGGIAVDNAIILLEFANDRIKEGYPVAEALVEASTIRLRPIMLTSLTAIFGLIPLAFGVGEGAKLQSPLAITTIGGLFSSTFLTLVFIPCSYLLVTEIFGLTPAAKKETMPILEEPNLTEIKPVTEMQLAVQQEVTPQIAPLPSTTITPPIVKTEIPLPETSAPKAASEEIKTTPKEQLLNTRQRELLEKLKFVKKFTRKEYAQEFGISIPTAARDLKELVDKKLIQPQGPLGPGRWYELVEGKDEST